MIPVGYALPPDTASLDLLADLIERGPDYYEVTPETLWWGEPDPRPNGFWRLFLALARRFRRPVVAHGVGLSLGSSGGGPDRRARWLHRIRADHAAFGFGWYTDHLGASVLDGLHLALPTPVPMIPAAAARLRRRLWELSRVVPDVGVENTCNYAVFGDPMDEPAFLTAALDRPRTWLLLDLHNVYTMGQNLGFDPLDWIARAPLDRVLEIHVSGGSESEPGWLPEGRILRLDSHDTGVPEAVWTLLEQVAPRCPNLRGITLERFEGTVRPEEVAALTAELARLREFASSLPDPVSGLAPPPLDPEPPDPPPDAWERPLAEAWLSPDPVSRMSEVSQSLQADLRLNQADPDGLRISALLISKLRFERLMHGSRQARDAFERDPASFAARFRRYVRAVAPTAQGPLDEARLWLAWAGQQALAS